MELFNYWNPFLGLSLEEMMLSYNIKMDYIQSNFIITEMFIAGSSLVSVILGFGTGNKFIKGLWIVSMIFLIGSIIGLFKHWTTGVYPEGQQSYYVSSSAIIFGLAVLVQVVNLVGCYLKNYDIKSLSGGGIWTKDW